MPDLAYHRVLLKLSGEVLAGSQGYGIHLPTLKAVAAEIAEAHRRGVQLGIVIGGGNIFRGVSASLEGMDRAGADHIGMIATVMNCLSMQEALEAIDVPVRVLSAVEMPKVAEPFILRRALSHIEKGRVVLFAGGTGNPYFTTDSAAALRALEIKADVLLKGTKVAGVYDKDPARHDDAVFFRRIGFDEVIERNLRVMDQTAIALCRENDLAIKVFNIQARGNIMKVLEGADIGTLVS